MTFRFLIALCCLAAAGCAVESAVTTNPLATRAAAATQEPAPSLPPPAPTAAEEPSTAPAQVPAPTSAAATSGLRAATQPGVAATRPVNPAPAAIEPATPARNPAASDPHAVAAAPTLPSAERIVASAPNSLPVASQPPTDTLDFTSLGTRLRTTKAIGVLTKLSVKNQADDLLEQFRSYHLQHGAATLPDLRRSYDTLVLKLLSLVQDGDPRLALEIDRSRTAIWNILADQSKFIDANLMAGASL